MSFEKLKSKTFSESDAEQFVKLLNMMHTKVTGLNGKEAFEYFKMMQWAQQSMLPKIKELVLGEPKVHELAPSEQTESDKSE